MSERSTRRDRASRAAAATAERVISPEERAARSEKARQLADVVTPLVLAQGVTDQHVARRVVRLLSTEARANAARAAGVRDPSPQTWGVVAVLVASRVEYAQHDPGDPFKSLPS